MTPAQFAAICLADYEQPADIISDGLHARFTQLGDDLVLSFRGSEDVEDWWNNIKDWGFTVARHPQVGRVCAAFAADVEPVYTQLRAEITRRAPKRLHVTGHSRGGGQGHITAGLLASDGVPLSSVVTFGCPRVGGQDLRTLLVPIAGADYCNGNDPVIYAPCLFRHPRPLTYIGKRRSLALDVEDHFMRAYAASAVDL